MIKTALTFLQHGFMPFVFASAVVASALVVPNQALGAEKKIKVLLISGDDVSAHNWKVIGETTKEVLTNSGKFDVVVSEELTALESDSLAKDFDLILMTRYTQKGTLSDKGKENLLNFVKSGKGFALTHLASASFKEWNEFRKMVGRYWVMGSSGHGPRNVFTNSIVAKDNPITKGLKNFETDDELYSKLQGDEPINVLVTADSDWSKKTEPLLFTLNYGQGRVFHSAYGHDGKAILNPTVSTLLVRGCEWAATGKVSEGK